MRTMKQRIRNRRAMRLERLLRYEELIARDGPDSIWAELREIDRQIEFEEAA